MARCGRRPAATLAIAAIALLPLREPLLVDGRVGLGEWRDRHAASGVQIRRDGGAVSLLVRTDGWHPVHVFVEQAGELRLLHASSALGEARYEREEGGGFRRVRDFVWTLADPTRGGPERGDLERAQREHLRRRGWVASTAFLGERGVVEFRLATALLDRPGVRWGVCYLDGDDGPRSLRHYPPGAPAIAAPDQELALLAGAAPARLGPESPPAPPRTG